MTSLEELKDFIREKIETSKGGGGDTLTKVEQNSLVQLGDVHPSSRLKSNCWRWGGMAVG